MSRMIGIDIGTNSIIAGISEDGGDPVFKNQRDCFYRIVPKTAVNKNAIKLSLDKRKVSYVEDEDGSFVVIGQDSLDIAIERNDIAIRPMEKGVISPKDKASLPMLKYIIESLIGKGKKGDKCVYSVPSPPVDGNFDVLYHRELMGIYIKQMGFEATAINEAFSVALSELIESGLSGMVVTYGAGLCNFLISHDGDPLIQSAVQRSGDHVDQSVATALDISPSLVQMEKEAGTDLYNPTTKIGEAIAVYYQSVLSYTIQKISNELKRREKELPRFRDPMPIVLAGGLTLATGFVKMFKESIESIDFPIKVGEIKLAENPMLSVANGALLAALMN